MTIISRTVLLAVVWVTPMAHAGAEPEVQLERAKESLERNGQLLADGARKLKSDPENWACAVASTVLHSLVATTRNLERLKKEGSAAAKADGPALLKQAIDLRSRAGDELLACAELQAPELKKQGKLGLLEDALKYLAVYPGQTDKKVAALARRYSCTWGGGDPPFVACKP